MPEWNKHVIAITGGTSGIGKATAIAFAKEGACVSICGRDESKGNKTIDEIKKEGGKCIFTRCDVSKKSEVDFFINRTVEVFGRLDSAFNNAGISSSRKSILDRTEEEWDKVIDINLKGLWLCMKAEIAQMQKTGKGSIVNVSSGWGILAANLIEDYCASKHGVVGLTKSVALDLAKRNIRINAICPGLIKTPINEDRFFADPKHEENIKKMIPIQRVGEAEEVAELVKFLCSDLSSYMTGCIIPIDGGIVSGILR